MRKLIAIAMCIFTITLCFTLDAYADNDTYEAYNEVMMVTGKLLRNFTEAEFREYYNEVSDRKFWGINVYVINKNVETTYISSTLYSVDNQGETDVTYELDVVVETAQKTTWSLSNQVTGSAKGTIDSFKTELASKAGIDYSKTKTESRKETQKMKLTIEKKSRAILYLMGNARITNGVCSCYLFWINVATCGFEYFTLVNQYPRLEKRSL